MRRPAKKLRDTLARNVRQMRMERNWSQEDLSGESGLSQTYLSQIESGMRSVSLDALDQLARAFSVSADQLLRRD